MVTNKEDMFKNPIEYFRLMLWIAGAVMYELFYKDAEMFSTQTRTLSNILYWVRFLPFGNRVESI